MVEAENQFEQNCKIHNEKNNMYCPKECVFICGSCISDHDGHGVIGKKNDFGYLLGRKFGGFS